VQKETADGGFYRIGASIAFQHVANRVLPSFAVSEEIVFSTIHLQIDHANRYNTIILRIGQRCLGKRVNVLCK